MLSLQKVLRSDLFGSPENPNVCGIPYITLCGIYFRSLNQAVVSL